MSRRLLQGAVPGDNLIYTFPDTAQSNGFLSLVQSSYFFSAAAGNRTALLIITDKDGNTVGEYTPSVVFTPGPVTFQFTWGGTGTAYSGGNFSHVHVPMSAIEIVGGDILTLEMEGRDAADQWNQTLISLQGDEVIDFA